MRLLLFLWEVSAAEPVAHVEFVDGTRRPVYEESPGRQYVLDDDGNRVCGIWFIPPEASVQPDVVVGQDDAEF